MDKLRNQFVKIAGHRKVSEKIGSHPFQCKTEINNVDEIRKQSGKINKVKKCANKNLVYLMISEPEGDAVEKDNGKIDNEDRSDIETQADEEYPHNLAETEIGKILQIEEIEANPGKKKEEQHNQ